MAKYVGNSFKDWWNAHYGTDYNGTDSLSKTKGMSEEDYAIGQKLYDAYLNENNLTAAYNTSKESLGQNKADAERAADISYQRLQKYLPQQLAKQGLYGTGLSEDAYLKLHSNYRNEVSDIDKNYNDNITSLENAYNSNLSDLRSGVGTAVEGVMDKYKQYRTDAYNEALTGLQTGSFSDAVDVENYLKSYSDKVSEQQYQMLEREAAAVVKASGFDVEQLGEGYIKDTVKSSIPTAAAYDFDSLKNGDDITVKIDGKTFKVESDGPEKGNAAATHASNNNIADGRLFVYGDSNDVYIYYGGVAYKVKAKSRSDEKVGWLNAVRHYLMYGTPLEANSNEAKQSEANITNTSTVNKTNTIHGNIAISPELQEYYSKRNSGYR